MIPLGMLGAATPQAGGGGPPAGTDPFWANVTSLLHFNGPDESTTIIDEKGVAWSRSNLDSKVDTAQSVFGGSSLFLNNGSIYAPTAGNFDFGTGDFTVECRVRPSAAGYPNIFSNRDGSGNNGITFRIDPAQRLQFFRGAGVDSVLSSAGSVPLNVWTAVRLVRSGSNIYMFVNGVLDGSVSVGAANLTVSGSPNTHIGGYGAASVEWFGGWIDEFRATKGVARSTSNYTVDSAEFPNTGP